MTNEEFSGESTPQSKRWGTILKRAAIVLAAMAFAVVVVPKTNIESLQDVAFSIAGLFPIAAPALIISALACFIFRRSSWITAFWIFAVCPVIAFLCLLGYMIWRSTGGSGPDWGFVGMGTGFALLFSLFEVIPGLILISACPPTESWRRTPTAVCAISTMLSLAGVVLGIQWASSPPSSEAGAMAFAQDYVQSYSQGRHGAYQEGFRKRAFVVLLKNPKTPVATLTKIASILPSDSPYWQTLARNPSLPVGVIGDKIGNSRIASELAQNPYLLPDFLKLLAESPDHNVRTFVARNVSTPKESLEKLAQDKDLLIRDFARQNLAGTLGNFAYRKKD